MIDTAHHDDPVAITLALAIKHLRARLRDESGVDSAGLSTSQLSIIGRLRSGGPATASALAAAEHVSQQAIAQSIAPLKEAGLLRSTPDPTDGRKSLISMTEAGRAVRDTAIASRDSWLGRAIDATIGADERATLEAAVELLERLADAGV
jgi:DNA-binding MarR family transcriptional regulator